MKITQTILTLIAMLFGLATIFAGTRVLLGSDLGYIVFQPLLIYNTVMGIVYIIAGIIAFRNLKQGFYLAATIFVLNLVVLIAIYFMYINGITIAVNSFGAMSLRTIVWLILFTGFWWLNHKMNPKASS